MTQFYETICPRCHQPVGTNPECTACNWIPKKKISQINEKLDDIHLTDEEYAHLGRS